VRQKLNGLCPIDRWADRSERMIVNTYRGITFSRPEIGDRLALEARAEGSCLQRTSSRLPLPIGNIQS
jgi:hypothetical protein